MMDNTSSEHPATFPAPPVPPQIIIQQERTMFGRFGKVLLVLLVMAVLYIIGQTAVYQSYANPTVGPQENLHSLSLSATKKIAIISVTGTILEGDEFVKDQIDRVEEDDDVVAVVLRVNSPGGTVTQSNYLYHHLLELVEEREVPLVVSMGSICASGGYYISMAVGDQTDAIFAEPTTWTGSIGVVIPRYDLSGLMERWDIEEDSITSGPLKRMGSPTRPLTEQERAVLQELVDISFADFKEIIRNGRPEFKENPEQLDRLATGQIYSASQALENGLIDKIGFIEDAIARAAELADYELDDLRCVEYQEQLGPIDALLGVSAAGNQPVTWDLGSLLNLTAPRAYYLYTWLPALLTNTR
jgi:protease IV